MGDCFLVEADIQELIQTYYNQYKQMVNVNRAIPSVADTLKPVHRRVLISAYKIGLTSTKSARIVGYCIANYHPHGDSAVYNALVTLVRNGLLIGRGNFGSMLGLSDIQPAAMRYTEAHLNPFIKDIAFTLIKHVPYIQNDLGIDEPEYLPTMLPLSLIQLSYQAEPLIGIGVSVVTKLPLFKVNDIVKLMMHIIENKKLPKKINTVYRNLVMPFNIHQTKLQSIKFNFGVQNEDNAIVITDIPPMMRHKLLTYLVENNIKWIDRTRDKTDILIYTDKLDIKLKAIKYTLLFVINNQYVKQFSLVDVLHHVYTNYKQAMASYLNSRHQTLTQKIKQFDLLAKLKNDYNKYSSLTPHKFINMVSKKYSADLDTVKWVYNNSTIKDIHEAPNKVKELRKELKLIQKQLSRIDEVCYNQYKQILS